MARINNTTTFPNTAPGLGDHVIGTDVSNTSNSADGETVTFKLVQILDMVPIAKTGLTSGGSVDLTGFPTPAREIHLQFWEVSFSANDNMLLQFIVGGSPVTTGYKNGNSVAASSTSGIEVDTDGSANAMSGHVRLRRVDLAAHDWEAEYHVRTNATGGWASGMAHITLAGDPTGIRVTRTGSANFDNAGAYVTGKLF